MREYYLRTFVKKGGDNMVTNDRRIANAMRQHIQAAYRRNRNLWRKSTPRPRITPQDKKGSGETPQ